jgi:hypothetical protein
MSLHIEVQGKMQANNYFNPAAILANAVERTNNGVERFKTATATATATKVTSRYGNIGFRYAAATSVAAIDATYNSGWQARQWLRDNPATVQLWRDRAVNGAVIVAASIAIAFLYASIFAFRAGKIARTAWERFQVAFDGYSTTWYNCAAAAQFDGSLWEQESIPMPLHFEVTQPEVEEDPEESIADELEIESAESAESADNIKTMAIQLTASHSIRQLKAIASSAKIAGFGNLNKSDLAMAIARYKIN